MAGDRRHADTPCVYFLCHLLHLSCLIQFIHLCTSSVSLLLFPPTSTLHVQIVTATPGIATELARGANTFCSEPISLSCNGLYTSLILKIFSCMEIFNKRHICFSLLAMRFRSSLIRPTNSRKPLMVWSSLSRHDLVSSVQLLHAMICDGASLIILYLCKKILPTLLFFLGYLMISFSPKMIIRKLFSWKLIWLLIFISKILGSWDIFLG